MERVPVTRHDWKTTPMGLRSATVGLDIPLSDDALETLKLGLLPLAMEDKWFIYYEESNLHFHRSWTGLEAWGRAI